MQVVGQHSSAPTVTNRNNMPPAFYFDSYQRCTNVARRNSVLIYWKKKLVFSPKVQIFPPSLQQRKTELGRFALIWVWKGKKVILMRLSVIFKSLSCYMWKGILQPYSLPPCMTECTDFLFECTMEPRLKDLKLRPKIQHPLQQQ